MLCSLELEKGGKRVLPELLSEPYPRLERFNTTELDQRDDQLQELRGKIDGVRDNIKQHLAEKRQNEAYCGVCWDRKKSVVLVPCGHLFCAECVERTTNMRCSLCKEPYMNIMKVHI